MSSSHSFESVCWGESEALRHQLKIKTRLKREGLLGDSNDLQVSENELLKDCMAHLAFDSSCRGRSHRTSHHSADPNRVFAPNLQEDYLHLPTFAIDTASVGLFDAASCHLE